VDDPDRLAAPLHGHHLAGLKLADIGLYGRTSGFSPLRGEHAGDKRHDGCDTRDTTSGRCGYEQATPPAIHFFVTTHGVIPDDGEGNPEKPLDYTEVRRTVKARIRETL
jgi:hypothetical protein